ncbi:MAG: PqqD family protein [Clostridia bacterium]|nr:PqqD family protein [Clostridia bacterium]
MRIKDGFLLREIGDRTVVVPVGAKTLDFRCIMTLNESGALLWRSLQQDTDQSALAAILLAEYEVDEAKAAADAASFVATLREKGLLDE